MIHYSTWVPGSLINPVHEIKCLEKCEYFETEYQQVICFNIESESSICLLSSHILHDSLIRLKVMMCVIRLNYNHDSSHGES